MDKLTTMSEHEDQYWEKIDDFLDGSMSDEDGSAFSQRLKQEEQLQKDLAFQLQLRQGIAYGSQSDLRERLGKIHQEFQQEGENDTSAKIVPLGGGMWRRLSVAAGLLIGALTILFLIQQDADPTQLYASNYEPYTLNNTSRSPGQDDPSSLAVQAYDEGDYTIAIPRLEAALQADPQQADLQLALAISHWEAQDTEKAKEVLQPLLDHPILQDQANWYAALFSLSQEENEQAIQYLEKVKTSGGKLASKAEQLLKQLQ